MNYIDLFSGIGGFAIGAYWAGMRFDKHYFSEVEPYAVELYRKRFPDAIPLGDITKIDWEWLKLLSCKGMSLQEIADYFSFYRHGKYCGRKNKGYGQDGESNHFYRGTVADDKAQNILESAVKRGIIARLNNCQECGDTGTFKDGRTKIQAHHCDYNKPLDVMWLCQKCHYEWHKNNKAKDKEVNSETPSDIVITGGFP